MMTNVAAIVIIKLGIAKYSFAGRMISTNLVMIAAIFRCIANIRKEVFVNSCFLILSVNISTVFHKA